MDGPPSQVPSRCVQALINRDLTDGQLVACVIVVYGGVCRAGYPITVNLDGGGQLVTGSWSQGAVTGDYDAVPDGHLALGCVAPVHESGWETSQLGCVVAQCVPVWSRLCRYIVDSSTYWCLGYPVLSPFVPDNSVESLLKRFHTPEVIVASKSRLQALVLVPPTGAGVMVVLGARSSSTLVRRAAPSRRR